MNNEIIKDVLKEIMLQVNKLCADDEKAQLLSDKIVAAVKEGMIDSNGWGEIKKDVEESFTSYQCKVSDYSYLFETLISYVERIEQLGESLGSKDDSKILSKIAMLTGVIEVSEKLIPFIIDNNVAHLLVEDKLIKQEFNSEHGYTFSQFADAAFVKSRSSLFPRGPKMDKPLLYSHLEKMGRTKDNKCVSFNKLPESIYNMAPDPAKWVQPIFGLEHNEFFDILFECLAPDSKTRERLLECIAWKYRKPWIINLPCPVFCGVGGSGKSGAGIIFKTIVGRKEVNWSAKINDDTMKNTGYLLGKWMINYDDLPILRKNSKEHDYVKQLCHNKTFIVRDLYEKGNEADMTAWLWFNGNPTADEKSPIPLEGDGAYGVDRRFLMSIIKKDLIAVYGEKNPLLSSKEVKEKIDYHFNHTCTDPVEVAKWLGNIIESSGVDKKDDASYPTTYHGHDYTVLTNQVPKNVTTVFEWVFNEMKPDAISVGDLYASYSAYFISEGHDPKFKKHKPQFLADIKKIDIGTDYTYGKWNLTRTSGSSQMYGWRRNGYVQQCLEYVRPEWLVTNNSGETVLQEGWEMSKTNDEFLLTDTKKLSLRQRVMLQKEKNQSK